MVFLLTLDLAQCRLGIVIGKFVVKEKVGRLGKGEWYNLFNKTFG